MSSSATTSVTRAYTTNKKPDKIMDWSMTRTRTGTGRWIRTLLPRRLRAGRRELPLPRAGQSCSRLYGQGPYLQAGGAKMLRDALTGLARSASYLPQTGATNLDSPELLPRPRAARSGASLSLLQSVHRGASLYLPTLRASPSPWLVACGKSRQAYSPARGADRGLAC